MNLIHHSLPSRASAAPARRASRLYCYPAMYVMSMILMNRAPRATIVATYTDALTILNPGLSGVLPQRRRRRTSRLHTEQPEARVTRHCRDARSSGEKTSQKLKYSDCVSAIDLPCGHHTSHTSYIHDPYSTAHGECKVCLASAALSDVVLVAGPLQRACMLANRLLRIALQPSPCGDFWRSPSCSPDS